MTDFAGLASRLLFPSLAVLSVLAWWGGGATVDVTSVDEILQIVALPVILISVMALLDRPQTSDIETKALLVLALILLVPSLQLLQLPAAVWELPSARSAIKSDLAQAATQLSVHHWSLMPLATEASLWVLMPGVACFLAAMQVNSAQVHRLAQLILLLIVLNLGFGFFQVGLPPGSTLRLYPGIDDGYGGIFVNNNHQATALVVGSLLALGLFARQRRHSRRGQNPPAWLAATYAATCVVCLAGILPTGSRAGMIIGIIAMASGTVATGLLPLRQMVHSRRLLMGGIASLIIVVFGLISTWRWMEVDESAEGRGALARATAELAQQHAPLGSGIGSFVNVFSQGGSLFASNFKYVNHAHNEYVQWWLTGGVMAMLALGVMVVALLFIGWQLLRMRHRDPVGIACWMAVCAVLAHSWVDFPLRTIALMSVTALLSGLAVATVRNDAEMEIRIRAGRDAAPQPA